MVTIGTRASEIQEVAAAQGFFHSVWRSKTRLKNRLWTINPKTERSANDYSGLGGGGIFDQAWTTRGLLVCHTEAVTAHKHTRNKITPVSDLSLAGRAPEPAGRHGIGPSGRVSSPSGAGPRGRRSNIQERNRRPLLLVRPSHPHYNPAGAIAL